MIALMRSVSTPKIKKDRLLLSVIKLKNRRHQGFDLSGRGCSDYGESRAVEFCSERVREPLNLILIGPQFGHATRLVRYSGTWILTEKTDIRNCSFIHVNLKFV